MSKNFENEYVALTQAEVPDLWDRIEAGLTPKSAQDSQKVEASVIDFEREMDSQRKTSSNDKKTKPVVSFVKKYKTMLVAAVCVIVILPAAVIISSMGMGGSESESADAAPADLEYAVVTEAATEESAAMEETAMEETAAEEVMEEAEAETGAAAGKTEMAADEAVEAPKEMYEETTDGTQMPAETVSSMESMAAEAEEKSALRVDKPDIEDGTVLNHVTIRVLAKEEVALDGENQGLGNLYRVEVLDDADGVLVQGEEILVYISSLSSFYLPDTEETYEVMLEYDSTREYPFWLKSCY